MLMLGPSTTKAIFLLTGRTHAHIHRSARSGLRPHIQRGIVAEAETSPPPQLSHGDQTRRWSNLWGRGGGGAQPSLPPRTRHERRLPAQQHRRSQDGQIRATSLDAVHSGAQGIPCCFAGSGHQQHVIVELVSQDGATRHEILPSQRRTRSMKTGSSCCCSSNLGRQLGRGPWLFVQAAGRLEEEGTKAMTHGGQRDKDDQQVARTAASSPATSAEHRCRTCWTYGARSP